MGLAIAGKVKGCASGFSTSKIKGVWDAQITEGVERAGLESADGVEDVGICIVLDDGSIIDPYKHAIFFKTSLPDALASAKVPLNKLIIATNTPALCR